MPLVTVCIISTCQRRQRYCCATYSICTTNSIHTLDNSYTPRPTELSDLVTRKPEAVAS